VTNGVSDWPRHACRLADDLVRAGKLTAPEWRAAVCAVPRHRLVPRYYRYTGGSWQVVDELATIYSNTVLITAVAGTGIRSSATQPGLVTRMLESLDVHDGHRVLEIGTGTGYNAGLLCHRLGDQHVFSVDVEPDLVDLARERLAELGYHPTLVAGDGADGLPEHAPFDRIIATCAVPAVPWAWVEQTRVGGVVLTDLKTAVAAGSLVRLSRVGADLAEGHFDPTYAAFMDLRHQPAAGAGGRTARIRRDHDHARLHTTDLDPETPQRSLEVWFLATFELGRGMEHGYTGAGQNQPPTASWLTAPDGSWAEVTLAEQNGRYSVAEGGPRRLWAIVEDTHQRWIDLGRPTWERFGLTVTRDRQTVWLDHPDATNAWPLPGTGGPTATSQS
jgi:methyltransferase of ATP-grasp peptide maturase system